MAAAVVAASVIASASASESAQAQTPPAGKVAWLTEGRPALDFSPQTALGLYVKARNHYMLAFFADALTPEESSYWLARQSFVFGGKFEGQPFQADAAMNARVNALAARSVSLWGALKEDSKSAKSGALPTEHAAKDLVGIGICVGHNCGHYSGGIGGDDFAAQVKSLRIPTPAASVSGQTAALDVNISKSESKLIVLKGEFPFYVVAE